ncbi:hypothetical protein DPMN_038808 [Dreissena polymorpha]|uniref:Uncharacterized protein n=1 Tax=Dreissena polymorpha TaxID=45954 RepID=A0A9D4MDU2_DREPO|nr:hypothetical protein DPMN_038808 [Dreissena polymorpha]
MVSASEASRILMETSDNTDNSDDTKHHEEKQTKQKKFQTQVRQLVETKDDMGNPFKEDTSDLYTLDTKVVMSPEVIMSVKTAESIGNAQYESMIVERLSNNMKGFYETAKKNLLPPFRTGSRKKEAEASKVKSMKSDIQLFPRMYISCHMRDGDLGTFFEHENHAWPLSI